MDIEIKKKKGIPRKYWPYIIGAAVLAALLIWLSLSNFANTLKVERKGLSIGEVKSGKFNDYVSLDGTVAPISVVQISPQEGGVVMEKVVEEGAKVRKGDVMVRLSNSNLDLQILNAESELAEKQDLLRNTQISMEQDRLTNKNEKIQLDLDLIRKKRLYDQQKRLYDEQLNSREDYLQAKEDYELTLRKHVLITKRLEQDSLYRLTQIDQMNDNLENMRKNVLLVRQRKDNLDVRSQIDGEVGLLDVELGQNISPGQKIGQINDLSDYKIESQVDEHYIDRVHTGLEGSFERDGKRYAVRVRKVYPEVRDGRFRIDLVFSGERPANIRSGQTYYLDLQLGEPKNAVIIPKGTFFSVTGGTWIFVLDENGTKAYRRNIRIGRQNPRYYEVLEGLQPGEKVIVSGYEAYKDNEILILK
ncbi:MAG: efflux RND transporter periplasmic adaptor subunit [Bacteroidales bacterium]|jgi:HlyD family secretion protein|nr:efflux RND transporter periplasmic adaptor subunit [Bacteroidales bacterium]MCI1784664.1 efflux RND transporter periplasmic adaptor subunit [Bacteroidales bacterium]